MRPTRARLIVVAVGAAVSLAVGGGWLAGWLDPVEAVAMDLQMRLRGPRPPTPEVAIVAIDGPSIDAFGRWPWPRSCVAALLDAIAAAGARTIALDVVFSEPTRSPPGVDLGGEDRALAASIGAAGNVVLGYFFRREGAASPGAPRGDGGPAAAAAAGAPTAPAAAACAAPSTAGEDLEIAGWAFQQVFGGPYPVPARAGVEANLDLFEAAAAGQGFFSHERESGIQRHYDLVIRHRESYYPALALAAVARFAGTGLELTPYQGSLPAIQIGDRRVEADEAGRLWIDYRGPAGTFPTYSVADVLAGGLPPGALRDRLVFLGATETGIGDLAATPFGSDVPGVEVHANAADNLLTGRYIHDTAVQKGLSLAVLLLLGPLVALLVSVTERHLVGSLVAIAAVLLWPAACYLAFRAVGWHLHAVPPVLAGVVALIAALRYQVGTVEREKRRIKRTFRQYVSEAIVEEMLRDPERVKLFGERREMTVLFSDIRGFTSLSEALDSAAVVRVLNEFFTPMTRLVLAAGGTLDKYMGDALMAFFGAPVGQPDHAARACAAALAMRDELVRLNRGWRQSGRLPAGSPGLGIGIGLNSGEMVVGNMGSEQIFDYTVIGDAVNLGSRIEGLNKLYGTQILVSEHTAAAAAAAATGAAAGEGFLFRELDRVRVKGKTQPVTLFELVAARPAPAAAAARVEAFARGLAAYRGRDFAAAEEIFGGIVEAAAAAAAGEDGPAALFRERCRRFQAVPPPPDWDAVETLTAK